MKDFKRHIEDLGKTATREAKDAVSPPPLPNYNNGVKYDKYGNPITDEFNMSSSYKPQVTDNNANIGAVIQDVQRELSHYVSGDPSKTALNTFEKFFIRNLHEDPLIGGPFYLFMTRPSLNLASDNLWSDTMRKWSEGGREAAIMDSLSDNSQAGSFIKQITNTAEGFNPVETSAQMIQIGETWTKIRQAYMGSDNDSRSSGNFNIEYLENNHLDITKTHKVWYEYAQAVSKGIISPSVKAVNGHYLDYMSSLYYFFMSPDMRHIVYWARYTGVVPTGMPYGSFAGKKSQEIIKVSFPYSYTWKEDMDMELLHEFNLVSTANSDIINNSDAFMAGEYGGTKWSYEAKNYDSRGEYYNKNNESLYGSKPLVVFSNSGPQLIFMDDTTGSNGASDLYYIFQNDSITNKTKSNNPKKK